LDTLFPFNQPARGHSTGPVLLAADLSGLYGEMSSSILLSY